MSTEPRTREFLEGGAIAVAPADIDHALAALWKPVTQQGDDDQRPGVTRLSLGTLVVVADAAREGAIGRLCNQVSASHPSRALLVVIDPAHEATWSASISASCHLPSPDRPQVCSERILLRTGPDGVPGLPGAILPLLEPDVPATLWWDADSPPPGAVARELGRAVDRCLADLTRCPDPAGLYAALRDGCEPLSDLGWFRANHWREGLARQFDGLSAPSILEAVESVEVTGAAASDGRPLPAALLAGWVAGQLGWTPGEVEPVDSGEVRRATWRRRGGAARTIVRTVPVGDGRPGRLQAVRLAAPSQAASWSLERLHDRPRELLIEAHHAEWCQLPSRWPAPRPDPLSVLLRALTAPAYNPIRDRALRHAAWILGWPELDQGGDTP